MTNVAGHLREQNGMYQMILSWKDADGKRRTKSISTGLPVKGNKKRAESLLRKTQKEFNPETMQQVSDLPVSEYLNRWLRESVMNLPPETYGRYAYDLGRVVVPYFEKKRLSLKALSPRDLETFFRYERQQEEASVQQLLDWHKELTDALQYAVANNWLKVSPIKEVDPCLDNSPVLFTDFITDWLKMMKSRVEITTYTSYERAIIHKIVPYFEPLHYTLQDMEQHPKYIQDFYQHELDRGLTANTVIHYHANIRKCLQYAFQIGMIRSNPADRVERPRKEKFKSEIYSGEELEQLFKVIQGDPSEFGVIMAAFYGLRRSEIVGLKWDAIDFENKKISIQHTVVTAKVNGTVTEIARDKTKTKSSCRTLPLIPACEQMLNKMKKEQEQNRKVCGKSYCTDYLDYIYVDPMGKRIRPDFLSQHFPDFLVAHQMKRIRFHDLRHPYVKHTTKIFSLRLMDFQAQAYPDARRKTRGACQLLRVGQSRSPVRPLCNRKRFSCLPPQSKMSWILYAISMRLSGYTSTRSISSSASSVVSVSASKIALDASMRLSCRACSSCFCFACANTAA
mgnify:FL=1|nr:MAG TPA: Integrase [Caudoviricetes sp.]